MVQLSLLSRGTAETRISYYHLLALMCSLPFNFFYSHLILISFCLHVLIHFDRHRLAALLTWRNLVLSSVFFISLTGVVFTAYRQQAFDDLGRHILILIFPIAFCLSGFNFKQYRDQLLTGFSIACTAVVAYLYMDALYTILVYHLPVSGLFGLSFTNHNFSAPIDIHATFLSLQIGLALVFMLSTAVTTPGNLKWFYGLCACLLFAGLMQLSSKSVMLPVLFLVDIVVPFFLLKGQPRKRFIMAALSLTLLLSIGILTLHFFKTRYIANLQYDLQLSANNALLDSRLDRWQVALELIKQKPITGYGAGCERALLHEEFYKYKYYSSFLHHLNVHNQYLSLWLKFGLTGLLIYLITLAWGIKIALRRKDMLLLSFLLMITAVSFSENVLDVDKGVIFYAFFFSFLMFSGDKEVSKQIYDA